MNIFTSRSNVAGNGAERPEPAPSLYQTEGQLRQASAAYELEEAEAYAEGPPLIGCGTDIEPSLLIRTLRTGQLVGYIIDLLIGLAALGSAAWLAQRVMRRMRSGREVAMEAVWTEGDPS